MNTLIGENAGKIWRTLQKGSKGVKEIKKELKCKDPDLYLALGWLAREDKISIDNSTPEMQISLK